VKGGVIYSNLVADGQFGRNSRSANRESPEVFFEEMMPKGVNQGARPDVISPKPVSGQCDKRMLR
jgi:hypothetical protein